MNNSQNLVQNSQELQQLIKQETARLRQENERLKKRTIVNCSIIGIGYATGTPLIVEGVRYNNSAALWSGIGCIGISTISLILLNTLFK